MGKWAKSASNPVIPTVCGFHKSGQKVGKWTHFLSQIIKKLQISNKISQKSGHGHISQIQKWAKIIQLNIIFQYTCTFHTQNYLFFM